MKVQDLVLVALICACTVLGAMLVAIELGKSTPAAYAQTIDRAGDYIIASGQLDRNTQGVFVIDSVAKRANYYLWDAARKAFVLKHSRNLVKDFGANK